MCTFPIIGKHPFRDPIAQRFAAPPMPQAQNKSGNGGPTTLYNSQKGALADPGSVGAAIATQCSTITIVAHTPPNKHPSRSPIFAFAARQTHLQIASFKQHVRISRQRDRLCLFVPLDASEPRMSGCVCRMFVQIGPQSLQTLRLRRRAHCLSVRYLLQVEPARTEHVLLLGFPTHPRFH